MKLKLIALIALIAFVVVPSSAVLTANATIDVDNGVTQSVCVDAASTNVAFLYSTQTLNLSVSEVSSVNGLQSVIMTFPSSTTLSTTPTGRPGASTPFTSVYGNGVIGYQSTYNGGGTYTGGYIYAMFDNPIVVNTTGTKYITLTYSAPAVNNFTLTSAVITNFPYLSGIADGRGNKMMTFSQGGNYYSSAAAGQKIYNNIHKTFKSSYSVTEGGLGAQGSVLKTIAGNQYASKVYIFKQDGVTIQASDSALNTNTFSFNVINTPLYIRMTDAFGYWYNSTLLLQSSGGTTTPGITLNVDIRDASPPNAFVSGVTFAIQNTTSGAWANTTVPTGAIAVSDILGIPISSNQTVQICGGATGYNGEACDTFQVQYDGYLRTLFLTRTGDVPTSGNWNLIVTVKRNKDGQTIPGASVNVITGLSGAGSYLGYTSDTGIASFLNVPASSSAIIEVVKEGYITQSVVKTVVPNSTQYQTFELVRIGETPVATPIPTTTYTYVATTKAYPVPTDAYGNPLTTSTEKGTAAFDVLIDSAYAIMTIAVSLVFIWLLWMTVYLITGGDIITKMMRRGRR